MASALLSFRNNRTYGFGALIFDLILNEDHSLSNTITEHPIENGANFNDHIRNNPENVNFTGLITNFTIYSSLTLTNRSQDAFDLLNEIWQLREPVTVYTIMKVYENMGITNITVPRSFETGDAISINVSFKKMKIVKLQQITLNLEVSIKPIGDLTRQSALNFNVGKQ